MNEALREMTYDEQIADFIIQILAIETPFSVKRDLISHLLSLTYRHEREIKDALYTPTPSCAVRQGRWNDDGSCSVCGHCDWDFVESKYFRYCPNCGASMEVSEC